MCDVAAGGSVPLLDTSVSYRWRLGKLTVYV